MLRRLFLISLLFLIFSINSFAQKEYKIGMFFFKQGRIYDEAYDGVKQGLDLSKIKYKVTIKNAQRDKSKAKSILLEMDKMKLDVIVVFSSAGTNIAKALNLKTPVIATVINHPLSLGIKTNGSNKHSLSGTSYFIDMKSQFDFYEKLIGNIKIIGMIYDKNNPVGALAEMPLMKKELNKLGVKFIPIGVTNKSELEKVTKILVKKKVLGIITPTSRVIYGDLSKVLKITNKSKVPLLGMNKQSVEKGALAALYVDTYKLGR